MKKISASGRQVWPLYSFLYPNHAELTDLLCSASHLKIQKQSGKLQKGRNCTAQSIVSYGKLTYLNFQFQTVEAFSE